MDRKQAKGYQEATHGSIRLITDMLDVPADLIAYIYSLRWLIELFFKMFKHLLGCRRAKFF